jgi:hypothetical protein
LALATYQLNGYALQEFSCEKGKRAGTSKRARSSQGRADLYIDIPKPKSRNGHACEANIEAKQIWCSLSLGDQQKKNIENGLERARTDCENLREKAWKAKHSLALLFVVPYKPLSDLSGSQWMTPCVSFEKT